MYEMTAAELDSELAVELPERSLMSTVRVNIWAFQSNTAFQFAQTTGNNTAAANASGNSGGNNTAVAAAGNATNVAIQSNTIAVLIK